MTDLLVSNLLILSLISDRYWLNFCSFLGMDYSPVCRVLGFVVQFTYLQAFFWMNVLSFDIYKAFSKVKLLKQGARADEIRKLLFYTMYACGAPMLIIILSGKFILIFTI